MKKSQPKSGRDIFAKERCTGLNWRITTNLPSGFYNMNNASSTACSMGSKDFILSSNAIMSSTTNFESASAVTFNTANTFSDKIIKLADQRLVARSNAGFFSSTNNGASWSSLAFNYSSDSLSYFSNSYFCYAGDNTIRTRAKYRRCNTYYTVDIKPMSYFTFYPVGWPTCPLEPPTRDYCTKSCQREDGRIYYSRTATIGTLSYVGVERDY